MSLSENQLISKIAIELAIAAASTSPGPDLDRSDFDENFDAIAMAKVDGGAFSVYVEAARAIIATVKSNG